MIRDPRALAVQLRPFVARRVGSSDVDDVLQEILQRVHAGADTLDDEGRFAAWLHQVARHAIADHHRRAGRLAARHQALAREPAWSTEAAPGEDAAEVLARFVGAFVQMLPSPYREALRRTELEGHTMRHAAALEGVSVTAMKSRVQRGRRLLRELVDRCCEISLDARGRVVEVRPRPIQSGTQAATQSSHVGHEPCAQSS